ncbi:MAG: ATP-binding cassette domain-containing protein [Candidatus Eremiobacteraeota bacterium]|nr:ATP-binding cassette domain-containing protein [Candidatus Eremiobacteraeota bacterium]
MRADEENSTQSEERIPEGGLAAVRAAREALEAKEAERARAVAEERIPEGGLAGLKARPGEYLVEAVSLTKSYLGTEALRDVNLKLRAGEIFGLVGPNGAGKTTLLRILATLTQPDKGQATVCGHDLSELKQVRARIGFMSDVLGVYDDMLVGEYLDFFARASNLPDSTRDFSVGETLEIIGLAHVKDRPVDGLSRGMKQRLALGRAILHKPKLLLLDEPASGLDPLARRELRNTLRSLQRQGATVLISSHVLEDLAEMCDRIGVMSNGVLVCVEETQRLIRGRGSRFMRLRPLDRGEELFQVLRGYNGVEGVCWDGDSVIFQMEEATDADIAKLLREIVEQDLPLLAFGEAEPNLESAYLNVTRAGER